MNDGREVPPGRDPAVTVDGDGRSDARRAGGWFRFRPIGALGKFILCVSSAFAVAWLARNHTDLDPASLRITVPCRLRRARTENHQECHPMHGLMVAGTCRAPVPRMIGAISGRVKGPYSTSTSENPLLFTSASSSCVTLFLRSLTSSRMADCFFLNLSLWNVSGMKSRIVSRISCILFLKARPPPAASSTQTGLSGMSKLWR